MNDSSNRIRTLLTWSEARSFVDSRWGQGEEFKITELVTRGYDCRIFCGSLEYVVVYIWVAHDKHTRSFDFACSRILDASNIEQLGFQIIEMPDDIMLGFAVYWDTVTSKYLLKRIEQLTEQVDYFQEQLKEYGFYN